MESHCLHFNHHHHHLHQPFPPNFRLSPSLSHAHLPFSSQKRSSVRQCYSNLRPTVSLCISHQTQSEPEPEPEPEQMASDLAPIPESERTFTALDMASLWVGLVVGVPTYYLAGSLVDLGMAWWQAISTVAAANLILLLPLILTAVPGTKHGISFPVLARSSFGVRGAHVPTLLRALLGCGWFGIETWIGGEALFLLLPSSIKNKISSPFALQFACFLLFWLLQLGIIWRGMEGIRRLEKYAAPILIALTSCLLCWAYVKAGGFGRMLSLSTPPQLSRAQFSSIFFPSLNANISFWATLALNIPDFSRYARSQKDQILGQIGLPVFMAAFTFVGLAVTSSTKVIFGRVISDPIQLLGEIGGLSTTLIAIFGISLATITTNIAANVVAPANALVNFSPSTFSFRKGALVTALLGIAFQPWRLLGSSESFVYTWLLGSSALMGPIGGIILADYYLVKRMELDVRALYSEDPSEKYYYWRGFNVAALVALVSGILPVIPGFFRKVGILSNTKEVFVVVYNNAWFVSFFVSGALYWLLSSLGSEKGQHRGLVLPNQS